MAHSGARQALVAVAVILTTLALYRATCLPGVDFGDTPSFQTMAGSGAITPRDAYPLYFAAGGLFTHAAASPAAALNLASAVEGAVACGLIALAAGELSGSLLAGAAAALLYGASYTFWSQAVIAEVYALHACMMALATLLILRWDDRPSTRRAAIFFAVYALGFGNHLSMILLAPGFAIFLLLSAPGGWRSVAAPRVVAIAVGCAALGALQYAWNLHGLWLAASPPDSVLEAMRRFWFDVTKADWRDAMVMRIPASAAAERLRYYVFDLHQQFAWWPIAVALCGLIALRRRAPRRALLVALLYLANVAFALGYNVGDTHVFLLPSHLAVALLIAPGLVWLGQVIRARQALAVAAIVLALFRMYSEYPALDRSRDHRPSQVLASLTAGVEGQNAILISDVNWQIDNALNYHVMHERQDLPVAQLPAVLLYAPALIRDNLAIGRSVLITESAQARLSASYGPLLDARPDTATEPPMLADVVATLPPGTRYALTVLKPTPEYTIDDWDLARVLAGLSAADTLKGPRLPYAVIVGRIGSVPALVESSPRPFRRSLDVAGVDVMVRLDSWLPFDTIRRMGFGHVIANRRHALIVERGVSFVTFSDSGEPQLTAYRAGIFAPQRRYLIEP